ncbi:MAG: site-specific DNA-methyltransferase [Comamonadaceae bacterium]|nr:MAG: site-specific DNA-methyltransferase [Comamonadaceae bacterium]
MDWLNRCHFGDCLETMRRMPDGLAQTCVTSPPYFGLRDYGHTGQIGLEETPAEFVAKLVEVFREVRRVLRDDGTLWLNLGDSYARGFGGGTPGEKSASNVGAYRDRKAGKVPEGLKSKDLMGIPWRVAFALQEDGWYLRQDIIWSKPNPMPESVLDRCTKAHEYIFLLSKSDRYFFDSDAIKEPACGTDDRPQQRRAKELAAQAGLTRAHIDAIRACGVTDSGKARVTQDGTGKNKADVQALADEAKAALGGYYREFLISDTRNRRSVWTVATTPYKGAHFATFPTALIEPCILAGAPAGGVVLDPFFGSGTTGQVAQKLGRSFVGCELNPAYEALQTERLRQPSLLLEIAA